jgi:hypothetical protein
MSTTSTIGSASRNYSTITAWLAAFANGGWIGNCFNDGEFNAANGETFPINFNQTTSASNFITLTTGAGQSFKDNANAQTNALQYNQSNGVGIANASYAKHTLTRASDWVNLSNLQIKTTVNAGDCVHDAASTNVNCTTSGMVCDYGSGTGTAALFCNGGTFTNVLAIVRSSSTHNGVGFMCGYYRAGTYTNCTSVRPSDITASASAFGTRSSTTQTLVNCAGFGFTNFVDNAARFTGSNNCSDKTIGFGTSNQASKTYANQFVNTTNGSSDFRMKNNAADLYNNGTSTGAPSTDIVGTSRPQATSYDIGCWELFVASLNHYTLTAAVGTYTLAAKNAVLLWGHLLAAATQTYTFSLKNAGLLRGRLLAGAVTAYTMSAKTAGLLWGHVLPAAQQTYSFTLNAATFVVTHIVAKARTFFAIFS